MMARKGSDLTPLRKNGMVGLENNTQTTNTTSIPSALDQYDQHDQHETHNERRLRIYRLGLTSSTSSTASTPQGPLLSLTGAQQFNRPPMNKRPPPIPKKRKAQQNSAENQSPPQLFKRSLQDPNIHMNNHPFTPNASLVPYFPNETRNLPGYPATLKSQQAQILPTQHEISSGSVVPGPTRSSTVVPQPAEAQNSAEAIALRALLMRNHVADQNTESSGRMLNNWGADVEQNVLRLLAEARDQGNQESHRAAVKMEVNEPLNVSSESQVHNDEVQIVFEQRNAATRQHQIPTGNVLEFFPGSVAETNPQIPNLLAPPGLVPAGPQFVTADQLQVKLNEMAENTRAFHLNLMTQQTQQYHSNQQLAAQIQNMNAAIGMSSQNYSALHRLTDQHAALIGALDQRHIETVAHVNVIANQLLCLVSHFLNLSIPNLPILQMIAEPAADPVTSGI